MGLDMLVYCALSFVMVLPLIVIISILKSKFVIFEPQGLVLLILMMSVFLIFLPIWMHQFLVVVK